MALLESVSFYAERTKQFLYFGVLLGGGGRERLVSGRQRDISMSNFFLARCITHVCSTLRGSHQTLDIFIINSTLVTLLMQVN